MYQLSHLLSEQKSLLTSLCSTSILGDDSMLIRRSENNDDEDKKQEEFNREKIASILEKVEGCKVRPSGFQSISREKYMFI